MDCFSLFALQVRSREEQVIPQRSIFSLCLFHRYDRRHFVDTLEISRNCYAIDRVSKHRGPVMSHAISALLTDDCQHMIGEN